MVGAPFIHAVNFAIAAAIVCGFSAIHLYDRGRKPAFWWTLSFVAMMLTAATQIVAPLVTSVAVAQFLAFSLNMIAIACLNVGIAWHCEKKIPWRFIDGVLVGGLVLNFAVGMLAPAGLTSQIVAALSLAGAQLTGLYLLRLPGRGSRDNVFALILALLSLNFLSRPVLHLVWGHRMVSGDLRLSEAIADINTLFLTIGLVTVLTTRLAGRLVRELKGQSETDSLSGLLNRHGFDGAVRRLRSQTESSVSTALIVCDLDRFKAINDVYGHYAGDRVIAAFGRLLRAGLRDGDVCGRFGGEEFCIYLRNSDLLSARLFAEWLRVAFASTTYSEFATKSRFTASFGVTEVLPDERIEDAYRRADEALYAAKNDGRNCVRLRDRSGKEALLSGLRFTARTSPSPGMTTP